MWVKLTNGNYRNTDSSTSLAAVSLGGGVWGVNFATSDTTIAGISEASEAAAQDVIRQLVAGVDAADIL